jgi:hypothetical protein
MNEDKTKVKIVADIALKEIRSRSFSGRHPELGKMIKCQICGTRHRSSKICKFRYAK